MKIFKPWSHKKSFQVRMMALMPSRQNWDGVLLNLYQMGATKTDSTVTGY